MNYFTVTNTQSAVVLGTFLAANADDALDAMAREAGYQDYAGACAVVPATEGEMEVKQVQVTHSLNADGQRAVTTFVTDKAKDGADAEAFFSDAEAAADDAFERELIAVLEIRASMSYDGRPHTLLLEQAWFDVRPINA